MVEAFIGFLPDNLVLICTVIAFILPYSIYKLNKKLHEDGDPAWKKADQENDQVRLKHYYTACDSYTLTLKDINQT